MQKQTFVNIINEIPPEKWESSLPIGAFKEIKILKVMKRFFSYIARCRVAGSNGVKIVFIKGFRNLKNRPKNVLQQKLIKDYQASEFWYKHFANGEKFSVVKPLFSMPDKLITVTEESRGENLYHLILDNAKLYPSHQKMAALKKQLFSVGEWLQFKQHALTIENERYSIDDLVEYMDVRFKILLEDKRRRFPADYRRKILNYIEYNRPLLADNELVVTTNHSDFNPGNILINGEKVTVLDFGRLVTGSYLLDVCKLHFQMQLLTFKPQYRDSAIRELQQSLLEGFGNPFAAEQIMFRFLTIRNILTHLTNVTHFWRHGFAERQYNSWVLRQELKMLDLILREQMVTR